MAHALKKPQANVIELFEQRLPKKPYHADYLGVALNINEAKKAIKFRYLQHNGPTHAYWLVFDVDRPGASIDWSDRGCPPPNFTVKNPANGHAHLFYGLEVPVRTAPDGSLKTLRYAAAIQWTLRSKLGADPGYCGLISKNPLNPFWQVAYWEENLYTLGELHDWLDLKAYEDRRSRFVEDSEGLGRNCTLFDRLRTWAYRAIRQGWPDYPENRKAPSFMAEI